MNNRELSTLAEALAIIDKSGFFGEKPTIEKVRSVVNKIKKKEKENKEKALSDYKKLEGNIYLLKDKKTSSLSMESYDVIHIHKIKELKTIYIDHANEKAIELEYTPLVVFSFGSFSKHAINKKTSNALTCKNIDSLISLNPETLQKILDLQNAEFKTHDDFINLVKKLK